jgi:peptide deformylase
VRPVRIYGDPVLRTRAVEVTSFDGSVHQLAADMRETMHAYRGVGLAANQLGVLQRVLVVDVPGEEEDDPRRAYTMINPVVVEREGSESGEEGCLSIPGIYEEVGRSLRVTVEFSDESGARGRIDAEGYLARAIQHEIDHLDGVLFVDRLSPLKRQFLRRSLESLARGELPEDYRPPVASGGEA